MSEFSIDLVTVSSVQLRCNACGHEERDHVIEDVPFSLEKQGYCVECDDWHAFVAAEDGAT